MPTRSTTIGSRALRDRFAADVRYYLTQDPRQLPSRYLYDGLGSALFEAICELPWYPLKQTEMRLLQAHGRSILEERISTVVELGSGSGEKLAALIAATTPRAAVVDLHLIDVSPSALAEAVRRLAVFEHVRVYPHETTYETGLAEFASAPPMPGRSLALFLGSNIGNFDPPGANAFLSSVRGALRAGDALLIGADLVKPERELRLAYDDPLGVTAAFNRNLLVRINRELGADFDLEQFRHEAVWNAESSRIEMHLVARSAQHVRIDAAGIEFHMAEGDWIWTESSYKYRGDEIVHLLDAAGFRLVSQWIDRSDHFALTLVEAA